MLRLWLLLAALSGASFAADLDDRGWHQGVTASRAGEVLAPTAPMPLALPDFVHRRILRRTFIVYYAPTCGHCKAAAPEIAALSKSLDMDFLGVASAGASPGQVEEFEAEYGFTFPTVIDSERAFARAAGARATPTVILVEPTGDGGLVAVDVYAPWFTGAGPLVKIRQRPADPFSAFEPGVYQGGTACAACHASEAGSWMLTHHALAYRTLYTRERYQDLECVGCHVTGLGEPTGFEIGAHRSPLAAVTCESCHSAGGPHDGAPVDARTTCVGCHDADHSVAFTVEKGLPHIDHFLVDALTDAEAEARFTALSSGELERPLLALPEGEHQGSASCRSCHKAQHKDWKKSPHRAAMASLSEGEAAQVECVRCHASPTASGPEPTALSGFRVDDGVGCESCHGPGEQHVAAPTTENIIGLGESCPECVIEEICTSCHTPKWDPNWDLKKRLKAVGH